MRCWRIAVLLLGVLAGMAAQAGNTPCSGRKGGIDHCAGATFICKDGSVSASKRDCAAYTGSAPSREMRSSAAAVDEGCSCRSHTYCTGPRGGQYCITDGGNKSYRRR